MKTEVMIEANTSNSASYANFPETTQRSISPAEAFVRAGHIFEFQPTRSSGPVNDITAQHIEINDFYPLDMTATAPASKIGIFALANVHGVFGRARPDIVTRMGTTRRATSMCASMT